MTAAPSMLTAVQVFYQHSGDVTKAYYEQLAAHGPMGELAVALFRALKRSKKTTGIGFRRISRRKTEQYDYAEAYEWAVNELIRVLVTNPPSKLPWGWRDSTLFVELPTGMVAFDCPEQGLAPFCPIRFEPPAESRDLRIIKFCDSLGFETRSQEPVRHVRPRES